MKRGDKRVPMPKVRHFNIRPERGKPWYYKVFLSNTPETMYALDDAISQNLSIRPWKHNYLGICRSYKALGKRRHMVGHIHICLGHRHGVGLVAHELLHAALYYWERDVRRNIVQISTHNASAKAGNRRRVVSSKRHEERFAEIVGELNRQYWNGFYRITKRMKSCPKKDGTPKRVGGSR